LTEWTAQPDPLDDRASSTVESTAAILPFSEKKHSVNLTEWTAQPDPVEEISSFPVENMAEKYNVNLTEWTAGQELDEKPTPEEKVQCQLDPLIEELNKDSQVDIVELPPIQHPAYSCPRCGRIDAIERNPSTGRLSCICYTEDYDMAYAGKIARTVPAQQSLLSS